MITLVLDSFEHLPEVYGGAVIARLHEQMVGGVGDWQEVIALKTILEEIVEHVLGSKRQLDVASVS